MSGEVRVLIAPDKFKGSATAGAVADSLRAGILDRRPAAVLDLMPVADGGDGTVAVLIAAGWEPVDLPAADVRGRPIRALAARRGDRAVVELAQFAGLAQVSGPLDPLGATSWGLGVALTAAWDLGLEVTIALGGSASTDGGLGMLIALGARAVDGAGRPVTPDGHGLLAVADLDLSVLRRAPGPVQVATDVTAPLHGPQGAAVVFGPQKGATSAQVSELDAALARWARILQRTTGTAANAPGAGAAGGLGAAAIAAWNAEVVPGADLVLTQVSAATRIAAADLVITGEGSFDDQSLLGKAPGTVLAIAERVGVPVVIVAGRVDPGTLAGRGITAHHALTDLATGRDPISDVHTLLREAGAIIADHLP